MKLQEYYDTLKVFDWNYERADEHKKYLRGRETYKLLRAMSEESNEHTKVFDAFCDFYYRKGDYPKDVKNGLDRLLKEIVG